MDKEAAPVDKALVVKHLLGSMEKEAAPVDKMEGAKLVISVREESGKEETVPVQGILTKIDSSKGESTKEESVLNKQESPIEDAPSLPRTSTANDITCESIEYSGSTPPYPETQESTTSPDPEIETQETERDPSTSNPKLAFLFFALSFFSLIAGVVLFQTTINSKDYKADEAILASTLLLIGIFFVFVSLYYGNFGFNPATLWVNSPGVDDQSMRYEELRSEIESEDIENQRIGSSSSDYLEATDKQENGSNQSIAAPSQEGASSSGVPSENEPLLQPTTSEGDSKLSGVKTKEGPEESVKEKPTQSKDQNVGEKADDNLQKNSEQEGLSSTELRRRNFQNQDSCADLTKSSEVKK